jgi:hypothetical protein
MCPACFAAAAWIAAGAGSAGGLGAFVFARHRSRKLAKQAGSHLPTMESPRRASQPGRDA